MKFGIASAIVLVCLFGAVTYIALEANKVAIVETRKADGTTRKTHVWFVKQRKDLWLEAGSESNGWFQDILQTGELSLSLDSDPFRYKTKIDRSAATQKRVRALLRERYGWRDWWVGFFVDHASAIPVQLVAVRGTRIPQGKRKF